MKKHLTFTLATVAFMGMIAGCSNGTNIDIKNFKLENISDYSAIGYGSVKKDGSNSKKQKKRKNIEGESDTFVKAIEINLNAPTEDRL